MAVEMTSPDLAEADVPDVRLFGVAAALADGYAALDTIAIGLDAIANRRLPVMREPIRIDSQRLCLLAYGAALQAVRHRFWTTTYLSSGFWGIEDPEILAWNRDASEALRCNGETVRRLFLLNLSPEAEVRRWRDQQVLLHKYGDAAGARGLDERLHNLIANVDSLIELGCDVRIAHDSAKSHRQLPPEWEVDGSDAELAIYDDWRFDIFRGGGLGSVRAVDIYTPALGDFEALLLLVSEYFDGLWSAATPAADFLRRIRSALDQSAARIEYHPLWLARYDHDVSNADDRLKRAEFAAVETILRSRQWWGAIPRLLDVGTCTARYPIALREAVAEDGEILGVDLDWDAVRFARHNVREACADDARVHIEHADFCAEEFPFEGPFQVITCMLGTLTHFPRDAVEDSAPPDDLQRALERFRALLAPDGVLFFTIWTDEARRTRNLLSIYSEEDKRKLALWDCTSAEMEVRLAAAGLEVAEIILIDCRMQLYCCGTAH
jgi:SAM-dependent methyltransferase